LQLLKSMRSAYLGSESNSGGLGKDTFMSIADQALADYIGENDGLGMAKIMENHFARLKASNSESKNKTSDSQHIPLGQGRLENLPSVDELRLAFENLKNLEHNRPSGSNMILYKGNQDDNDKTAAPKAKIDAVRHDETEKTGPQSLTRQIEDAVSEASEKHGLPRNLIEAIIRAESNGDPRAVSSKGAKGLMQLIDTTAADMGVADTFDVKQNVMGGSKYVKMLLDRFKGDLKLTLAAYNAGPGNVQKYGGMPPFTETRNYVEKVIKYMNEGDLSKDSKLQAEKPNKEEGWSFSTKR